MNTKKSRFSAIIDIDLLEIMNYRLIITFWAWFGLVVLANEFAVGEVLQKGQQELQSEGLNDDMKRELLVFMETTLIKTKEELLKEMIKYIDDNCDCKKPKHHNSIHEEVSEAPQSSRLLIWLQNLQLAAIFGFVFGVPLLGISFVSSPYKPPDAEVNGGAIRKMIVAVLGWMIQVTLSQILLTVWATGCFILFVTWKVL